VPDTFARHPLRQRIIALVAAYAIALASLVAGLAAAEAAVKGADGSDGVICHSDLGEAAPGTGSHESNGAICLKSCIGCISALATVMPPRVAVAGPPQLSFERLDLLARSVSVADTKAKAHRSRGPPPAL
jgi:hypothetical protein